MKANKRQKFFEKYLIELLKSIVEICKKKMKCNFTKGMNLGLFKKKIKTDSLGLLLMSILVKNFI